MSLALLAARLAASVNTTCLFALHVCPLPVSNYRLTLGAPSHFILGLQRGPLRLRSLRTRLTWRHPRLLHPSNYQFTTSPRPHHCHSAHTYRMSTTPTCSAFTSTTPSYCDAHTTHNTTIPQHTKFYIPLTVEDYCFLTAGQDDDTRVNLFDTTATSEPATRFLPLYSLPGKLHQPAYDRLQLLHSAADAHLWHYYSLTELHTSTNHVNDDILGTMSLPTDYTQQLLQDNNLDYFVRDYKSHSTSISLVPLPGSLLDQLQLQRLHPTLHHGHNTQQLLHLYQRQHSATCCPLHVEQDNRILWSLLVDQYTRLRGTPRATPGTTHHDASFPGSSRMRGLGEECLNYMLPTPGSKRVLAQPRSGLHEALQQQAPPHELCSV